MSNPVVVPSGSRRDAALRELVVGWRALVGAFLGTAVGYTSLYTASFPSFIRPLEEDMHWGRGQIATVISLGGLITALLSPLAGYLIDRWGVRPVASLSLLGVTAGLFAYSIMPGDYRIFLCIGVLTAAVGAGSTPVVFTRLVNGSFLTIRGFALGFSLVGLGLVYTVAAPLLAPYVAIQGWRAGFRTLALLMLIAIPLVWMMSGSRGTSDVRSAVEAEGQTLRNAARTRSFWLICVLLPMASSAGAILGVHFLPLLLDAGFTPLHAGAVVGMVGFSSIFAQAGVGFLLDRIRASIVIWIVLASAALGCLCLTLGGTAFAVPAAIGIGFAVGAEVDLIGYLTAKYFGLKHYGKIYGVFYGIFLLGYSGGAIGGGIFYDHFGDYYWAVILSAILFAISAVLGSRLKD